MNRIRALREALGLSADDLAERMGTSATQVRRLESGARRLTVEWMQRAAIALQCSPADVMLDVSVYATDDVEPTTVGVDAVDSAIKRKGLSVYRVLSSALISAGIAPGTTITVDDTPEAVASLQDGDAVIARRGDGGTLMLRQFLRPGLLTTNRPGNNEAIQIKDLGMNVALVGVLVR